MDNEETKILNPQQGTENTEGLASAPKVEQEQKAPKADGKKAAKTFGARMAATAAGAALGTGVAMAADHVAHGTDQHQEVPEVEAKEDDAADNGDAAAGKETVEAPAAQPTTETHEATMAAVETATPASAQYASMQPSQGGAPAAASVHTAQEATVVSAEIPSEQQAVVITDEGVHVAQVDDSDSFQQAFADARAQVGAGGVFEWHGKVYSTFYENEWNGMSATERAEWQSHVDYSDVTDAAQTSVHAAAPQHTTVEHVVNVRVEDAQPGAADAVPEDASYIDHDTPQAAAETPDAQDSEVHVIGVAVQDNGHGGMATIAGLQSGDDMAMVVDVDSDGTVDYVVHDDNGNGQFEASEWHDVNSEGMPTAQVVGAYVDDAHQNGTEAVVTDLGTGEQYHITETEDGYGLASMDDSAHDPNSQLACNDDMPDYMNDADPGVMEA